MIDFPNSPATNDTFTAAGKTWVYNGTAWELQGIVVQTITDGDTTHAPSGDAVFDAMALKAAIPKGYIDGLQMQWVSGTALTVTSGAAYIEASAQIVEAPSAIAKTGLSLAASTWYHVYFYLNAGTPDVEVVTTAPAGYYSGTARSKTADTSRRYLGSVKTSAAGAMFKFQHAGNSVVYLENIDAAPFRNVSAGSSTTAATVACADACPLTAQKVNIFAFNASGVNHLKISASGGPSPPGGFMGFVPANTAMVMRDVPLNSAGEYVYAYDAAGGSCFLYVAGYAFGR